MRYSFEKGVPMAILTDGKEWSFYLPTQIGDYQDRRVYKLNLLEREDDECSYRLSRYLDFENTNSGETIKMAQEDYKNQRNKKIVEKSLPEAWKRLVNERDEILIELLANSVENVCGFKPDNEMIIGFLEEKINIRVEPELQKTNTKPTKSEINNTKQTQPNQTANDVHFMNAPPRLLIDDVIKMVKYEEGAVMRVADFNKKIQELYGTTTSYEKKLLINELLKIGVKKNNVRIPGIPEKGIPSGTHYCYVNLNWTKEF